MAFSETQKNQVRMFLGYSAGFRDATIRLESMFEVIGANPVEQASVEAILTELASIDVVLASAGQSVSSQGAIRRADDVEFFSEKDSASSNKTDATTRGRILVGRLARRFGVPALEDYFAEFSGHRSAYINLG